MNGKKIIVCVMMTLLSVKVFAQSTTIDEAIGLTASEMGQRLTKGHKIAVLNFSSEWQELSTYVIDELNNAVVRNGSLTVVDRQQLNIVRREQNFQMSGEVSDESAQSIGKFLGAQSVLSGSFTVIGNTCRFRIRVIAVETGVLQYSNSLNIKKDSILTALMPKPPKTEYNFFEKFGIGLLNIPFGIGSLTYEPDKDWGYAILWTQVGVIGFGGYIGGLISLIEQENFVEIWTNVGIFTGIGFGIVATVGFFRGFFVQKSSRRIVMDFPIGINIVPVSYGKDFGVQMFYKLKF